MNVKFFVEYPRVAGAHDDLAGRRNWNKLLKKETTASHSDSPKCWSVQRSSRYQMCISSKLNHSAVWLS
jgi:hypothetical protein